MSVASQTRPARSGGLPRVAGPIARVIVGTLIILGWAGLLVVSLLQMFEVIHFSPETTVRTTVALLPLALALHLGIDMLCEGLSELFGGALTLVGAALLLGMAFLPSPLELVSRFVDFLEDRVGGSL